MAEAAVASDTARLAEFARIFKAASRSVTLYPDGHPSIDATLGRLTQLTNPPVQIGPVRIGVTPDTLLLDGQPVAKPDAVVADLAGLLHAHLIGELTVQPGGSVRSWRQFLLLLEAAPDEIRDRGGIAAAWLATGHTHIELREIDYAEALRERFAGASVTWERVVGNCLRGDALDIPDELLSEVFDDERREQVVSDALDAVEHTEGEGSGPVQKADVLIKIIGAVVRSMAGQPRERVEPVMRDLSAALGRLSPETLVSVIERMKRAASAVDPHSAAIVEGLVDGMSDTTISSFVARNAVGYAAPVERVVQAFQALVWDNGRRERLVSLARTQAQATEGQAPDFDGHWRDVAQKLLKQYDDQSYVADSYAAELNHARTQAVQIEQLGEDPPEQLDAWRATVTTAELRKLDLTLVADLLAIEQTPDQRAPLAQPVLALLKDLLLVGDFDALEQLLAALRTRPDGGEPSALELGVLEQLASGATIEHLLGHLATSDQAHVGQVTRVCLAIGEPLVGPLAEALAHEDRIRIRERVTETILAFGDRARAQVSRLKESADPAVRRTAAYLLRELGVTEDLPDLQDLVLDTDTRRQRHAVQLVIGIGSQRGFRLLIQALTTATPSARRSILQAMAASRDERTVDLLLQILEHVSHAGALRGVYEQAVEQLGQWNHPSAVAALIGVLQRGEWWAPRRTAALRSRAAAALARIGTPEALEALTQASASGPRGVRRAAAAQLQMAAAARSRKEARG